MSSVPAGRAPVETVPVATDAGRAKSMTVDAPPAAPVWQGWAIALTAITLFSFATPIARAALVGGQDPVELLVVRMALATAMLGATIGLTDRTLLRVDRRCIWIALGAGLLNGMGMLGYFWGLERLESSMAAMLIACSPIAVLSLLALRGERVTYRHAVRLALALSGVYLLIGPGGDVDAIGVLYISGSLLFFAVQVVLIQWYLMGYDARTVTFFVLVGMTIMVVAKWLFDGAAWHTLGREGWMAAVALAFFSTYLSRLMHFTAISRIGGAQMTMLSPVETLLTVFWSFLFLGERLTLVQWMGGLLILTSAVLAIQRLGIARLRPRWRLWIKS